MKINIADIEYNLKKEYKNGFDKDLFTEKWTDDFKDYDYVVGDFSYNKLRLKGFYKNDNKKVKEHNNYKFFDEYLKNNCSFECKYFVLEKLNN